MNILFMCVANSARSQMAEGLAKKILGPGHEIKSAGSHPSKVNPNAVLVMKEIGIDISDQYSKSYDDLEPGFLATLDYLITLCAEEVCPQVISRARKLHWPISDPVLGATNEERARLFSLARDSIQTRIISELAQTLS